MIIRILAFVGGVGGATVLSQYPEFAQQYTQRLAGQVEALGAVVADFDASAARSELSRAGALAQMTGTAFLEDRRADMLRTIGRYESLAAHHVALAEATPMQRLLMPHRLGDAEVLAGTWTDFVPAVPLTAAGGVAAAAGFLGGWGAAGLVSPLFLWPFRRRYPEPMFRRVEPPIRGEGRREPPLTGAHPGE